jgi:hypothetical protein
MKLSLTIAIPCSLLLLSAFAQADEKKTAPALRRGINNASNNGADNYFALISSAYQEVPACMSSALGTSNVVAMVRDNHFCIKLSYDGLNNPELVSQVHGPAAVGETGPAIFSIDTSITEKAQCFELTKDHQKKDLDDELWYFNIHSERCPNDAIRGQILPLVSNVGTIVQQLIQHQPPAEAVTYLTIRE